MADDEFTKLFKYMEKRLDAIEKKLGEKSSQSSIDRLTNSIDGFIARINKYETELAARDAQFQRLLSWARKVLEKTGIPLESL